MTEQDVDPNFRSGIPYQYKFTLTKREDGDIYKGFSHTIVPHENPNDPHAPIEGNLNPLQLSNEYGSSKIHAIHLQNDAQVSDYSRFAKTSDHSFKPFLNLKPNDENLGGTTIAVGGFIGVPLLQWISDKKRNGWEYDVKGNYLRLGSDWRDVIRLLGGPLYMEHCAHRFVGNLLHSTFVNGAAENVVFVKDPVKQATLTTEQGIQDDLKELKNLFKWLESSFPVKNLTTTTPPDLSIFYNFYPGDANLPTSVGSLKELSYFMCHNFLGFHVDQRFAFCVAYSRIRHSSQFLSVDLSCNPINFIDHSWGLSLPSNGAFEAVYKHELKVHGNSYGLIHFHRSCEEHYNDEADKKKLQRLSLEQLDKELLQMFPEAIPRVFNALFKSRIPKRNLIDAMKMAGIDYT